MIRVLRVYHSGVVSEYRVRDRLLRERHGHDVHLVVPPAWPEGGAIVEAVPDDRVPLHVVPIRGRTDHPILFWYDSAAFRRVLREVQPDLIDLHEEPYSLAAWRALRDVRRECPSAAVCIYSAQNVYKRYPPPFGDLEQAVLSRAAAAYPCSRDAADVLRRKGFAGEIAVLPLGVSVPPSRPSGDEKLQVGFVGRLVPEKGGAVAVQAFARAAAELDASLEIVGSGPEESALRRLAAELGLDGRVVFSGALPQAETLERIAAFDVLLVPSLSRRRAREQFGRVAAEALAAGVPVLASRSGALPEVIGDCGELAQEGSVDEFAEKLGLLLGDGERRRRLGEAGRRKAEAELAWKRVAEGMDRLYTTALRRPERPVRVAFLDHTAQMGGAERALAWLVTHLDRTLVAPTVVLGEEGPLAEQLRSAEVDVVVVPLAPALVGARKDSLTPLGLVNPFHLARLARASLSVARALRRIEADVVHTNSLKAHLLGGLAGRMAGAQVVWHVRDHLSAPYLPHAAARAMRLAARVLPHRLVAVSESVARSIGREATVLHQGVPLPTLRAGRRDGPLRVGLVGRISPWKGQDVFLAAAGRLAREFPDVEFVVAGAPLFGEEEFELELHRQARVAPLAGRVTFLGFQEDVWEVYRDLDIVVHASTLPEPYGNVVVEAMASRRPIVASAAGGVLELVEDGRTGLLVPPGDVTALAAALAVLLRDPERRAALARAGREDVERRFSPTRDAEAIARVYRELAA